MSNSTDDIIQQVKSSQSNRYILDISNNMLPHTKSSFNRNC